MDFRSGSRFNWLAMGPASRPHSLLSISLPATADPSVSSRGGLRHLEMAIADHGLGGGAVWVSSSFRVISSGARA